MPELQMDVAVANRFISSLSKSLQALCHGCMDFDSGIEIVGYINVNIDCGSKVDYVLNEKVLKSTTNSMTFVSNSFLARKEQQKQTRDGMCSPIQELNQQPAVMSSFQNRARGYLHGLHSRSAAPTSHSYVHHGSQKRSWTGMEIDSRITPKKSRDGRPSLHEPGSTAQRTHSNPMSSSFSQNPADANFKWPQTSVQGSDTNIDNHEEVNIKKELLESDSGKEIDQSEQDQSQTDQDANDNAEQLSGVPNIKCDPDASTASAYDETAADESANVTDNDYKGTFLEPSTSEKNEDISEQNKSETDTNDDNENTVVSSLQHSEDSAAAEEVPAENVTAGPEVPVEFDEAGEEGTYPHSVYSDAGEGSSDAGQFEVIEIEDEDEDVQAMFGEPQKHYKQMKTGTHHLAPQLSFSENLGVNRHALSAGISASPASARSFMQKKSNPSSGGLPVSKYSAQNTHGCNVCQHCSTQFNSKSLLNRHMTDQHPELPMAFPYNCAECGKGFFSQSGLNHHIESHFVKSQCSICDHTFKYSRNLKRHLEFNHQMKECRQCKCYIKGELFRVHVLQCTGPQSTSCVRK